MGPLDWWRQEAEDSRKDKDYHPQEHRYGFPGHSRDTKSYDGGSPTTGQTWSDLDPDGRGDGKGGWSWRWMIRRDWLAPWRHRTS